MLNIRRTLARKSQPLDPAAKVCHNENMRESFYFYDLETSGLRPREDRIMQFAGQRTDLNFHPLGEPTNLLVQLSEDTLPSPGAIMVTGITPQATQQDGISEREFCQFFLHEVATPGTTIMGYNSVRFDDEFIRATLWRNFYDAYAWQWKENRSRWDLLDVVRLTRALRPEGIEWPVTPEGKPTNRLELLTKLNHIEHAHAHDALADVMALIEVAKLIRERQPQLYQYLYRLRGKHGVAQVVSLKAPRPFVYASGRYSSQFNHTTVAYPLVAARHGNVLVFDLRYNLEELLTAEKDGTYEEKFGRKHYLERRLIKTNAKHVKKPVDFFPIVKTLQYNHCPAVAPLGVLDKDDGWQKIGLEKAQVEHNLAVLKAHPDFAQRMTKMLSERPEYPPADDAETAIYDGFLNEQDELLCSAVRSNDADDLADFHPHFSDERLPELLLHYKARNFPSSLAADEVVKWEEYRARRLARQAPKFLEELQRIQGDLAKDRPWGGKSVEECAFLAEELMLWYESLQPGDY